MSMIGRLMPVRVETCQRCHQRPATHTWSDGGMDFARGYSQQWCEHCVVTVQLEHALKVTANIQSLKSRLLALDTTEAGTTAAREIPR